MGHIPIFRTGVLPVDLVPGALLLLSDRVLRLRGVVCTSAPSALAQHAYGSGMVCICGGLDGRAGCTMQWVVEHWSGRAFYWGGGGGR